MNTYSFYNNAKANKVKFTVPSKTVQGLGNEVNINQIMARAMKGQSVPISRKTPIFGDFSTVSDYKTMKDRIIEIHDAFMALPPDVRSAFGNDESHLMAFLADPKNREKAEKMGLLESRKGTQPLDVSVPSDTDKGQGNSGTK